MFNLNGKIFEEIDSMMKQLFNETNTNVKMEKTDNNKTYCSYKAETYNNGQLTNKIVKVWENGKLVKNEGETHALPNVKKECKCDCEEKPQVTKVKQCCCDKNEEKVYHEVEQYFLNKLQLIEKEVDGLSEQLKQSQDLNDKLIDENKRLVNELNKTIDKYNKLENKFEELRKFIN